MNCGFKVKSVVEFTGRGAFLLGDLEEGELKIGMTELQSGWKVKSVDFADHADTKSASLAVGFEQAGAKERLLAKFPPGVSITFRQVLSWSAFEDGATLGQKGSESGDILLDEEYDGAARITLERGGTIAPFAVTCGVYGWAMHTRFFGAESEARGEYEKMKDLLAGIVERMPQENDPDRKAKDKAVVRAIEEFVAKCP